MSKVANYNFGGGGVNLVKNPLQLADDEATQLQNAEFVPDQSRGGVAALSKRGGLAALTSALAGAVLGFVSLPLQTTYTRTLYAALEGAAANTWKKTTNGTSWTDTSSPLRATTLDNNDIGTHADAAARRAVSYKTVVFYPGNAYTADYATPANNTAVPLVSWDGTNAVTVLSVPAGASSDGNYPFSITDMVLANGKVYFSVHDSPNSGAPDMRGRVLEFNPATSVLKQVATAFGPGTSEVAGGCPSCLVWHQGQLFVGLDHGAGTDSIGKVVRCYPDIDATWTTDVTDLKGPPMSMAVFNGDLYVGLGGNATSVARVVKRAQGTGLYATSDSQVTSGVHYYGALVVYGTDLYATVFSNGGTDFEYIRKFDGTTWTTDRDITANDSAGVSMDVGNALVFGSDLFVVFKATGPSQNDGFIMKKSSGTWSKVVSAANLNGRLVTLTERS